MQILLRLTRLAFRYRYRIILAYITLAGGVAAMMSIPWLIGTAVDELTSASEADKTKIFWLAAGILGASILRGFFDFGRVYFSDTVSQRVSYDLRNSLYDSYQQLSFAYHDTEHTGNLMSKATADVEGVRRFINMGLMRSVQIVLMVAVVTILMFRLNPTLALISLSFVPFLAIRSTVVIHKLRNLWTSVQERMGEMVTILQENLSGMKVVKSFAAEEFEKDKFASKTDELAGEGFKADKTEGANSAIMTFFFTLVTGFIVWFGGRQVVNGDPGFLGGNPISVGDLIQFVFYMSMLQFPIRMAAWTVNSYSRAISSGERIFEVLDAKSAVQEKPDALELGRTKGAVQLTNVSFSYTTVTPVLKNVTIDAPPGRITAILGAPGSGKTTIVHLIPRFYDVSDGVLTIDGHDLRDVTLDSLRRNVGIVQQDVFLFGATIKDNISYGAINASTEDIISAAKAAQLHDFIMSLPDQYETWVGEQGATLSGGQRQRLSIARTLLIDPPVLILDDSTSSVDVETERLIRKALSEVIKGRTTFIIAHRLSTVRGADQILVMKDGEVAERGTHQELYALGGIYREIYELQLRPQEEIPVTPTPAQSIAPATLRPAPAPAGDDGGDG